MSGKKRRQCEEPWSIKKGLVFIARQRLRIGTHGMTVFTFQTDDPEHPHQWFSFGPEQFDLIHDLHKEDPRPDLIAVVGAVPPPDGPMTFVIYTDWNRDIWYSTFDDPDQEPDWVHSPPPPHTHWLTRVFEAFAFHGLN